VLTFQADRRIGSSAGASCLFGFEAAWCGGSEVRIIVAANSLSGLLNQGHTRSIGLLVSFDSEI
jgi:hypothetical protein